MRGAELSALLPERSLLGACTAAELDDFADHATLKTVKKGAPILEQGEDGDRLVVMIEGAARVSMVAINGREIILDYAEPGAVLGEIALFDGEPRTASVTAMKECRLLQIGRAAFEAFIERHPRVAILMMREMARRLRQTNTMIESDRAFTAGSRLARYLQRLSHKAGDGERLRIDLSQGELGNFVGVSRENINRQLSSWADAGVIALENGKIRILDPEYLAEIAEIGAD